MHYPILIFLHTLLSWFTAWSAGWSAFWLGFTFRLFLVLFTRAFRSLLGWALRLAIRTWSRFALWARAAAARLASWTVSAWARSTSWARARARVRYHLDSSFVKLGPIHLFDSILHIRPCIKANSCNIFLLLMCVCVRHFAIFSALILQVLPAYPGRKVFDSDLPLRSDWWAELHTASWRGSASASSSTAPAGRLATIAPRTLRATSWAATTSWATSGLASTTRARTGATSVLCTVRAFRLLHHDPLPADLSAIQFINCIISIIFFIKIHKCKSLLYYDVAIMPDLVAELLNISMTSSIR